MISRRKTLIAAPAILLGLNRWTIEEILGRPAEAAARGGLAVAPPAGQLSCGVLYPDATTTGVPAGTVLSPSGQLTINASGTYQNLNITGNVRIRASNVLLKNCLVQVNDPFIIEQDANLPTGVVIQDMTINGLNNGGTTGYNPDGGGGGSIIRRCNIFGCENGIGIGEDGMQIRDNYIHNLFTGGEAHTDGIQGTGGFTSLTIDHNSVFSTDTSCVIMSNVVSFSGLNVNNNLLVMSSGSACFVIRGDAGPGVIGALSITNNRLGSPGAPGSYNDIQLFSSPGPVTYTGNVDWQTCAAITQGQ